MNESENILSPNEPVIDDPAMDDPAMDETAMDETALPDDINRFKDAVVMPFVMGKPSARSADKVLDRTQTEKMSVEEFIDSGATVPMGIWRGEAVEPQTRQPDISLNRLPYIAATSICHVGAVRERNDDSALIFESQVGGHFNMMPFGLYIVADGMGGHSDGHIASKIASRVASHEIIKNIYLPLLRDMDGGSPTPIQEVLSNAGQKANTAVYEIDPEADSGTTLTGALLLGRRLHAFHVGDSRAYLFSDGKLEQITKDHSLVQRLLDVGQLTNEEAAYYEYRHVLLRALGQADHVEIDTYMRRLPPNGRLLLCSDGLCGLISDHDMQTIIAENDEIDIAVEELFTAAVAAGGHDNITAIMVDFAF